MYVAVARPRFTRPVDDEEERRVLDELIPLCEQSGGFHALYTVRLSERELANLFFWDTRADAERGFAAATPRIRGLLAGALVGPPDRVEGDLLFAYEGRAGSRDAVLLARPRFTRPVGDEEARQIMEEVIPLYQRSGGFHTIYSLRVTDREVVNISFWVTQSAAERGFLAAAPYMRERYGGILDGRPEHVAGDLLFAYPATQRTATDAQEPR